MKRWLRLGFWCLVTVLAACGGGGGGSSKSSADASNAPAAVVVTPPNTTTPVQFASSPSLLPIITRASISNGVTTVDFQVTDENYNAIQDVTAANVRFIIAKLQSTPIGNLTGNWQSYINRIEQPGVGPGLEAKLQATTESGSSGTFTNNGNGTYRYQFSTVITALPANILTQAAAQQLNLDYVPTRTHRVAIQFSGGTVAANPVFDFVPATGKTTDIFHNDIVAIENCNGCHGQLALHGGGRVETRYCVTCHNSGSADANSGNTVDFKVMIHKIHRGANLPSVVAGGDYGIYGFSDTLHDYSELNLPQDIRNCQICHAGSATHTGTQTLTSQGDNWAYYATRAACGSCHDDLDFSQHFGGQTNDDNCMSCHSVGGVAGSIQSRHVDPVQTARSQFSAQILDIQNSAPGQFPVVDFAIVNPEQNDRYYDIKTESPFVTSGASVSLKMAWSTTDYTNTGNGATNASSVSMNALSTSVANGDGTYRVTFTSAVPAAATGSGTMVIEGRVVVDVGTAAAPDLQRIPLTNVTRNFSIDETGGNAVARRTVVALDNCLQCHGTLSLHGGNRTDSIGSCVTCHNPRNSDRDRRPSANPAPTDGKPEQSIDFKVMIHGIHAAAFVQNPLQIVGFGGTVNVFDTTVVHYPGELKNCNACHVNNSFQLPLNTNVLATTIDSGADKTDPSDDVVISPQAAVCSSCHDDATAKTHMEMNGASFSTLQADVDSGVVLEQCSVCHGAGRTYAVDVVHGL